MRLLDEALLKRFAEVGSQDEVADPIIIAKFFNPAGAEAWYATEFDQNAAEFFGYVSLFGDWNDEWGYFSLDELQSYTGYYDQGIERDLYWKEKRASQAITGFKGFGK